MAFRYQFRMPAAELDSDLANGSSEKDCVERVARELRNSLAALGGKARVTAFAGDLEVAWTPSPPDANPMEIAVAALSEQRHREGIVLLRLLRSAAPDDPAVVGNLGMALSDVGRLDEAIVVLERACVLDAADANTRVALGVALARDGADEEAVNALQAALALEPDNPWAHRNLGACLLQAHDAKAACEHLLRAVELAPSDQQSHVGLAQAYEALGDTEAAEAAYRRGLALNEYGPVAEAAREGLTRLAERAFRTRADAGLRPDAVMYLLDAVRRFRAMDRQAVERIVFEIAMLGRSGLDVNDSERVYTLTSLGGERTGLNLVCLLYAGMKIIAPDMDAGFDISAEYAAALSLVDGPPGAGE